MGSLCRTLLAIESHEGPSKVYGSVKARYPDILLSDLRSANTTSRKGGKTEKPAIEFRFLYCRQTMSDWRGYLVLFIRVL
jgi:hypothetical protein